MKVRGFLVVAAGVLLVGASPTMAVTQRASDAPKIKVVINTALTTASQLVLDVSLPGKTYTKLVSYKAPDGKYYYKVAMPGLTTSFDPTKSVTAGLGRPGIPALSIPFAIPEAAVVGAGSQGYSNVTTEILSASFNDTKITKEIFPASTQPLDAASSLASVGLGYYLAHCLIGASDQKISCWGKDGLSFAGAPINSINSYLEANPLVVNNVLKPGHWHDIAMGFNPNNVYKRSYACAVGEPGAVYNASYPNNYLYCFGQQDGLSMTGVGTNPGQTPGVDILDIDGSGGFGSGTEFCFLRNYGNAWLGPVKGQGEIRCFGRGSGNDWASPPMTDPATGAATHYTQLSVGYNHACAIVVSGRARCFGRDWTVEGATLPPTLPPLKKVIAGNMVDCGIKLSDNKIVCWGLGRIGDSVLINSPLPPTVAASQITDMSIGDEAACTINTAGKVTCFPFDIYSVGANAPSAVTTIPASVANLTWKSIQVRGSTPYEVACAVSTSEKVTCWGNNTNGQADPPDLGNAPVKWNDPIFDDFVPAKLYEDMPDSLVRPFIKVPTAYTAPAPVPSGVATGSGKPIIGPQNIFKANPVKTTSGDPVRLRGLGLGQLYLYGGQYTAATKKLRIFSKVRVKIKFTNPLIGGDGKADYGLGSVSSAYNQSFRKIYGNILANADIALANLSPAPVPRRSSGQHKVAAGSEQCGEEMLVVSHPDFAAETNTFVNGKNAQGLFTRAVYVGDPGVGSTADSIRDFVQGEFSQSNAETGEPCVTPSYLTLIGNTAKIPTFSGDTNAPTTPGDIDYSLPSKNTYVPDLSVGRLPAANASEAGVMVSKILAYENATPSSSDSFFKNVTITSFFQNADPKKNQDQRGFIRTSEQLRAALIKTGAGNPGKTVERLYSTSNPTGTTKLMKDDLGRSFPKDIQKTQKQAPWNVGNQTSVVSSVKSGRFLLISRDHGNFDRIFNPAFGTFVPEGATSSSVSLMTNGPLAPIAWLIACLSGRFDDPANPSFAEAMLGRSGGGMVGVLASSRESPSEVNNSLTMALADAVWPSILPTGNKTPIYRMGDVVNAAKLQVLMSGGPSASVDILNEMRLYNWFGDPSMQLWVQKPAAISTALSGPAGIGSADVKLTLSNANANGATAVLLGDGDVPIGKAVVKGTSVAISPQNGIASSGSLKVVLIKDQALPTTLTLRS